MAAQQSADLAKVGVPAEAGTGRVSQAASAGSTLSGVETKKEIREFLTSRRGRITPEQAGLSSYGGRRVPGLRREEVAVLAGVSAPYYTRLERGDMSGVSESVLEALARALQLDDAERAHLFDLARAAQPTPARPRGRRLSRASGPRSSGRSTRSPAPPRSSATSASTSSPPTSSDARCSPSSTPRPRGRSTPPGSSSSIREPRRPTATGTASPRNPSPSCARPRAATHTTATSQTSSASSQHRARRSAPAGPRTTSASTTPVPSTSTIPTSASST